MQDEMQKESNCKDSGRKKGEEKEKTVAYWRQIMYNNRDGGKTPVTIRENGKEMHMKTLVKRMMIVMLVLVMVMTMAACNRSHVSEEVYEISKQGLVYVDEFLADERDVMAAYTGLYTLYAYWDALNIQTDKSTVTPNFQAKMMFQTMLHSFEKQASGEDAREDILRQRNRLAEICDLPINKMTEK